MRKMTLSKLETRVLIVVILINGFALFVNYFHLSPKFDIDGGYKNDYGSNHTYRNGENSFYLFSDSAEKGMVSNPTMIGPKLYDTRYKNHFWPFTKFIDETSSRVENYDGEWNYNKTGYTFYYTAKRFRGIFADYDHTEFFAYCGLIIGTLLVKKLW
jgi:hypothetical protein